MLMTWCWLSRRWRKRFEGRQLLFITAKRLTIGGLCLAGAGMICIFSFGDTQIAYTVVNGTDQTVVTWHLDHDCSVLIGHRGDYGPTKTIPARTTMRHVHVSQGGRGCIQVATSDRQIVKIQKYTDDAVVRVSEPVTPLTEPVPEGDDLSRPPLLSPDEDGWRMTIGLPMIGIGLLVALIGGLTMVFRRYLIRSHPGAAP